MQRAGGKPRYWRLFTALELPIETRGAIADWGARTLDDPALRPIPEAYLHITMVYLGGRPEADALAAAEVLLAAGTGEVAPEVRLTPAVGRPGRGVPSVFALPVISAAVEAMQGRLQRPFVEAGLCLPESRPFWPHVTIARVRPQGSGSRRPVGVAQPPGELPEELRQPFFCRRLTLYRSDPQSTGVRFVSLAKVELPEAQQ